MDMRKLLLFCLVYQACECFETQDSVPVDIQLLRILSDKILKLKAEIPRFEEKLSNDVEMSELALRAELLEAVMPGLVKGKLRETLGELFKQESLQQMVNTRVTTEIRALKQEQIRIEKQYQNMSEQFKKVRKQNKRMKKQLRKFNDEKNHTLEEMLNQINVTLNTTVRQVGTLKKDMPGLTSKTNELEERIELLERKHKINRDNKTWRCHTTGKSIHLLTPEFKNGSEKHDYMLNYLLETSERVSRLEDKQRQLVTFKETLRCNMKYANIPTQVAKPDSLSTTFRSRLLMTSSSRGETKSQQMTLNGHVVTKYPYLEEPQVISTAYDPTRNLIVFSLYYPDGIYTAELDGTGMTYLYSFVGSYGLAVDAGRQLIFMTTYNHAKTVSRVTTFGRDFSTVVDLGKHGYSPISIALDPENNMIYTTNSRKVFSVDYYGNNLQVLHEGRNMRTLTLDLERGFMYFSNVYKIMRWSIHRNSSEVVTTWTTIPHTMRYYNDTVYVSGSFGKNIYALDVNTDALTKIATVNKDGPMLCLIP